jgi:hypothetical protein
MAAYVLRRRMHADVDSDFDGLKVKRSGPGVVDRSDNAALASKLDKQRHILHFECQ